MKITLYNIQKGIRYLKNYGLKEFFIRLGEKKEPENILYSDWYNKHKVTEKELKKQRKESGKWESKPLFCIVLSYVSDNKNALKDSINSILKQSYDMWQVCVVNAQEDTGSIIPYDSRIKIYQENIDEVSDMLQFDYVTFLACGDILAPNALYEVADAVCNPDTVKQSGVHWNINDRDLALDVIYTDEDSVSGDLSEHYEPEFKPDFNLDLLRANNYIKHFLAVKKDVFLKAAGMVCTDGVDKCYDFVFKCIENAGCIVHIPKVLYHCRCDSKKISEEAEINAINSHLNRCGVSANAETTDYSGFYRIKYSNNESTLVSILIPNKDERESLDKCIKSVAESYYDNLEVIVIENNSIEPETFEYYENLTERFQNVFKGGIRVVKWDSDGGFNYSAINNFGRANANGEYLVLLNNDIEIISRDWINEMLSVCSRREVGIVGAKLYYPDNTIQHAGIVAGIGGHVRGIASNMCVGLDRYGNGGYLHKASTMLDYSAVTAACLMIKTSIFDELGGFEEQLTVAFNDVDLCLKARKAGYLVVYDPYVEAYHYESKSRGQEDTEEKVRRFQGEIEFMRSKWNDIMRDGDPYYNPNFSRVKNDYSLNGMD